MHKPIHIYIYMIKWATDRTEWFFFSLLLEAIKRMVCGETTMKQVNVFSFICHFAPVNSAIYYTICFIQYTYTYTYTQTVTVRSAIVYIFFHLTLLYVRPSSFIIVIILIFTLQTNTAKHFKCICINYWMVKRFSDCSGGLILPPINMSGFFSITYIFYALKHWSYHH